MHQIQFSVIKKPHKNLKTPTYIVLIEPQNKMRPVIKYWYMLLYHVYSLGSSLSFHQALVQNLLILRQKNVYKKYLFTLYYLALWRFQVLDLSSSQTLSWGFLYQFSWPSLLIWSPFECSEFHSICQGSLFLWLKWNKENIISSWTRWVIRNVFI